MTVVAIPPISDATSDDLERIRRYRKRANIGIAIAVLSNVIAVAVARQSTSSLYDFRYVFFIFASLTWYYGLAYYMKAKGRSLGWAVLGIFGIFGLIVLSLLSDRNATHLTTKRTPWTRKVIFGLLIFMMVFYGLAVFMTSRSKSAPIQSSQDITLVRAHTIA